MPNGGGDNCGSCRYNSLHPGVPTPVGDGLGPCRCLLRNVTIEDQLFTYCANHPHHDRADVGFPVGPVRVAGQPVGLGYPVRHVLVPSPDTEAIRVGLLQLLASMSERPPIEYPSPTRFDDEVIWQLGELRETRALPGLERVIGFSPLAWSEAGGPPASEVILFASPWRDRQRTVAEALVSLAKILGPEALPLVEPFVSFGRLGEEELTADLSEIGAPTRVGAIQALVLCGPGARSALTTATTDPVERVAAEARVALTRLDEP